MPVNPRKVLILGGTAEARRLAQAAVAQLPADVEIISSYAGRTERPAEPPGTIREGGFGGVKGLTDYLKTEAIWLVIDATHPFAATMSAHAEAACRAAGCPRMMVVRPAWQMPAEAICTEVDTMQSAAARVAKTARRVFLSTGSRDMAAFGDMPDIWFLIRLIAPPAQPLALANYQVTTGRPPYALDNERALLETHAIDTLVSKHSGGPLPAKITAAAALGLPIVLIERPAPPPGKHTETIEAALAWIQSRL